ncbi:hypothetical protein TgHK011_005897 [Trichoderma gracile]|nr:hypothetical protein TgHK011_005897 [Trichoderma gracile]
MSLAVHPGPLRIALLAQALDGSPGPRSHRARPSGPAAKKKKKQPPIEPVSQPPPSANRQTSAKQQPAYLLRSEVQQCKVAQPDDARRTTLDNCEASGVGGTEEACASQSSSRQARCQPPAEPPKSQRQGAPEPAKTPLFATRIAAVHDDSGAHSDSTSIHSTEASRQLQIPPARAALLSTNCSTLSAYAPHPLHAPTKPQRSQLIDPREIHLSDTILSRNARSGDQQEPFSVLARRNFGLRHDDSSTAQRDSRQVLLDFFVILSSLAHSARRKPRLAEHHQKHSLSFNILIQLALHCPHDTQKKTNTPVSNRWISIVLALGPTQVSQSYLKYCLPDPGPEDLSSDDLE